MKNRCKQFYKSLDNETLEDFRRIVQRIVELEHEFESEEDYDGSNHLINQLYNCGVSSSEFDTFQQVIEMANDPDYRSPK